MMAGMLTQLPLPLLPAGAAEIAPGVGLVTGGNDQVQRSQRLAVLVVRAVTGMREGRRKGSAGHCGDNSRP